MYNIFKNKSSKKRNKNLYLEYRKLLDTNTKDMTDDERHEHLRKLCDLSIKLCPIKF